MHNAFTEDAASPIPLSLFSAETWATDSDALPTAVRVFAEAQGFRAGQGQLVLMPDESGALACVLGGLGDGKDALAVAAISSKLPAGDYTVDRAPADWNSAWIAAGWSDGTYRFERYLAESDAPPRLVLPSDVDASALGREAEAVSKLRDMVNTPAADMGPSSIQSEISAMAEAFGATLETVIGDALLEQNYPMVHAVGRAAEDAPRIMELSWGEESAPELAIVGKGVAFDTGGLNLKTGNYMRLMKKDMGGAAHAIALARLVMGANLPVRLKLYVPAVENAIAGNAFRPGDILQSRKGLTVEIDNTDAEGRLILADALARACEGSPDLLIDFATLTGAARIALGPDLAPVYTDDDALAAAFEAGAAMSGDPVWRMPLWDPYLKMLKSPIADIVNSASGFAGSITAALFLKQFVDAPSWAHLDVWAWREGKYGRPAGGAACGLRAAWAMVQHRYAD